MIPNEKSLGQLYKAEARVEPHIFTSNDYTYHEKGWLGKNGGGKGF